MGLSDLLSGACNCGKQAVNLPKEWELLGTEQGHSKGKHKPPGIVNTTSGWRAGPVDGFQFACELPDFRSLDRLFHSLRSRVCFHSGPEIPERASRAESK